MRDTFYSNTVSVSTDAAGAGSTTTEQLRGLLWGFYFNYSASADAGTDVTVSVAYGDLSVTILTVTDNKTDGWYPLQISAVGSTGASNGTNIPLPLTGVKLTFTIAGGGATVTDCLEAIVLIE